MHTTVANKIKGVWPRFSRLDPTGAFVPHVENKNCHLTIYFRLKKDFVPFFKNGTKLKLYLFRLLHLYTAPKKSLTTISFLSVHSQIP